MADVNQLQQVFATFFARDDLNGARVWVHRWFHDLHQQLDLGEEEPVVFTQRAMAGHVSDYLEGFTGVEPQSYGGSLNKLYSSTQYGPDLYWAMAGE